MVVFRYFAIVLIIFVGAGSVAIAVAHDSPHSEREDYIGTFDITFSMCEKRRGYNCVIDGDTIHLKGRAIQLVDIDAPELYNIRCEAQRRLGKAAAARLLELLNQGAVDLARLPHSADQDIHMRPLRTISREGRSLGDILIQEKLARPASEGHRTFCE